MDADWVDPIIQRLHNIDLHRLSGGTGSAPTAAAAKAPAPSAVATMARTASDGITRKNNSNAVDAARDRYLARKKAKLK